MMTLDEFKKELKDLRITSDHEPRTDLSYFYANLNNKSLHLDTYLTSYVIFQTEKTLEGLKESLQLLKASQLPIQTPTAPTFKHITLKTKGLFPNFPFSPGVGIPVATDEAIDFHKLLDALPRDAQASLGLTVPKLTSIADPDKWAAITASTPPASCSHTFKPYVGLSETFEFCTKCDERKAK